MSIEVGIRRVNGLYITMLAFRMNIWCLMA